MDLIAGLADQAKKNPKIIVFPEGDNPEIAAAASSLAKDGVVKPIVLVSHPPSLPLKGEEFKVIELAKEKEAYRKMSRAINPYGDGKTSRRIADITKKLLAE